MCNKWTPATLGDIAAISSSGVDKHIVPGEQQVNLCNYLDVYRNRRITRAMRFATGSAKPSEIERFQINKGDILITKDSETPDDIGIPSVVVDDLANTICGYHLALIRPINGVDSRFIAYHLQSDNAKRHFLRTATGLTRFGLNSRAIASLPIVLPTPHEQSAIARILDAVDTAIERTQEAVNQAVELKRSLVQMVFSEGLRRQRQKRTRIGLTPESWEVKSVGSVVTEFEYGLSLPMSLKGTTPILRMGNIQSGEVIMEDLKYVTLPQKLLNRYLLKRGDVLFNRTNSQEWVGKVGIYRNDEPAVFASYLIRLHPDTTQIDNYYLGQLLSSYSAQCRIKRYATPGVQQVNINAKNLSKVLIPVPVCEAGLEEQREIADLLEKADERVRSYNPFFMALEQLKKSLMHDLLTGKVRVGDSCLLPPP